MMFAERLTLVRKQLKLSQANVGKIIGINGDAYGRYERGEVKPTIEMAVKIANALGVSLDYLVGKIDQPLDNQMIKRINDLSMMPEKDKEHAFYLLDAVIAKTKLQAIL